MTEQFPVVQRSELASPSRVFYVTARGYAGDHLFSWFAKALNSHADLFALLAHEGSRPKYFRERTRGERPPLVPFTEFLNDVGMTYAAIGDCYSYRAGQMAELHATPAYRDLPVVNLIRHPVVWLEFYVRWRAGNMRMPSGSQDPLAWEWRVARHDYFRHLGLRQYERNDIDVWASFQGMHQANGVLADLQVVERNHPIEVVAESAPLFRELAAYLSRGKVRFDTADLDRAFSMRHTLFDGEEPVDCDPKAILDGWPGWKVDAFRKLVTEEACKAYKVLGYDLGQLSAPIVVCGPRSQPCPRPVFISSVPKSGTWLLRDIVSLLTGLKAAEPDTGTGTPEGYADDALIEFKPGTFFSWHSIITPRSRALLHGHGAICIFLLRNVYDVLLAMLRHISEDVDASIGRSVVGSGYFDDKPLPERLSLMIAGFTSPSLTWHGVAPLIQQMESMLEAIEGGQATALTYEDLTTDKSRSIGRLAATLGTEVSADRMKEIVETTERATMRQREEAAGRGKHVSLETERLDREVFLPYHKDMLDFVVLRTAPSLPERLSRLGLDYILSLAELPKGRPGVLG